MAEDNKNYEVEVNIYNMEFWGNGFTHDNIEFIPYGDYKERYEKIKNEEIHYPTGKAKISLSADTCNKAIEKAEIILSDYGGLLTFAQNRDVFFHYYICYEVENENRHEKAGLRSVVVGVDKPYGMSIIHPLGIEEFIKIAIPLVRDKEYVENTGIVKAINWFNVANQRHIKIVPTNFPIFWIALEMLANVEFKIVENKFKDLIENGLVPELKLNNKKGKKLKDNIYRCINRIPMEHKIESLLKKYGLEQYNSEIKGLKDFRNDIIHGNDLSSYNIHEKIDNERKLKSILEKLMLSMLHFYDNKFVHSSIRSDRLLALQ